jgi:prepilin-type N-terminal cleavage/methylation domain-containing protein
MKNMISPNSPTKRRGGFTLVEVLTVIVIIGILAGLLLPAVTSALRTAKEAAIRLEIDVMAQAMESYKLKYGEYPPDFADWAKVESHFRTAFPNIDNNELRILSQFTHYNSSWERTGEASSAPADPRTAPGTFDHYPHAIDRAEAIVLCLGGYSSDAKRPLTGQGGPLVLVSGATLPTTASETDYQLFQYNTEREKGFFDFDQANLSLQLYNSGGPLGTTVPYTYTRDEDHAGAGTAALVSDNFLGIRYYPDPFPTYHPKNSDRPIAYFSYRDYDLAWGNDVTAAWNSGSNFTHHSQNVYLPSAPSNRFVDTGIARPYVKNSVDTTPATTIRGITVAGTVLQFAEDGKFQLISAGLDNNYGGVIGQTSWGSGSAGIGVYPSGEYYNPFTSFTPAGAFSTVSSVDKFQDDLCIQTHYSGGATTYTFQPQLDNITNFTTRTFEADLP